jgi:hypothetical protein
MTGQLQADEVNFKLCERCGKVMLIHEKCDCYNELSKPSNRNKEVSKSTKI